MSLWQAANRGLRTLFALACLLGCAPAVAEKLDAAALEALRAKHDVPAMGVYLMRDGEPVLLAATGERAKGSKVAVTTDDLWHIGSNTKAMTATLVARLVEQGKLGFDTKVADVFKEEAASFDPAAAKITIAQLLSHRAGLPADPPLWRLGAMRKDARPLPEQRLALTKEFLARAPRTPPGTSFAYSNLGYIIVGAVIERVTGKPFETALADEVMAPLGITHFGFGAPGTPGKMDQPRGHQTILWIWRLPIEPVRGKSDNPPVYGSAGGLHISLRDWMKFAQDQLVGPSGGGRLLKPETYQRLQTPPASPVAAAPDRHQVTPSAADYAFGWGRATVNGHATIQHAGSNTLWFALITLVPDCHSVLLLATNDGSSKAKQAIKDARGAAMDPETGLCPGNG